MMRGVPIDDVVTAMGKANWPLMIAVSLPAYVANVYFRALRWRHLTNPIVEIPRPMMFKAEAIGFMVNNIVPLRIGEVVRAWWLAKQVGVPGMSIFGTVALERVIDVICLLGVAGLSLALVDAGNDGGGGLLKEGAMLIGVGAAAPLAVLIALRVAPGPMLDLARFFCRPLPDKLSKNILSLVEGFADGLGAIKGGTHLFWIAFHSVTIWLVVSSIPVWIAVVAFGIDLGGPLDTLAATWILLAASGVAAAIPSAPGFFGPYQIAFKEVLEAFGVDPATALGLGLLVWVVFWVIMTGQGLLVLRLSKSTLGELTDDARADSDNPPAR